MDYDVCKELVDYNERPIRRFRTRVYRSKNNPVTGGLRKMLMFISNQRITK